MLDSLGLKKESVLKYFKNTSWMVFERVFRLIIVTGVGILMTRYLGKAQFGLLSYCTSFVSLFAYFATFGVKNVLLRELVSENKNGLYMGTAFVLHLIGAVLSGIIIYIIQIVFLPDNTESNTYILVISSTLFFQSFHIVDFYYQAKVQAKYAVYALLGSALITSALKVVLMMYEAPLLYFVWVVVIESILLAIGLIFAYKKASLPFKEWKFSYSVAKYLLKHSIFFMFAGVVAAIYLKIDQLMITEMLTEAENGLYAAAVRFSEAGYFLPIVICNSLMPAIVHAYKKDKKLYMKRLQQLYNLMAWLGIFIAIVASLSSDWVITFCLGDEYLPSIDILKIHIWALVFVFIGVASDKWLVQEERYYLSFYRMLIGAVLNILLNLYLIPNEGIKGAAYATLISYAVAAYFSYPFLKGGWPAFKMQTKGLLFPFLYLFKRE